MSISSQNRKASLPYGIAKDLIEQRIFELNHQVESILKKWNQTSLEVFTSATRSGKIQEAETDALIVENLSDKVRELEKYLEEL